MPVKTRDEIEKEWWAAWRWADYSWSGRQLRFRRIGVADETAIKPTLQDYWRLDPLTGQPRGDDAMLAAGELVEEPVASAGYAKLWHIAHVPLRWEDGTPAKIGWDARQRLKLDAVIRQRLAAASPTTMAETKHETVVSGNDGRAQLAGAVLEFPYQPSLTDGANLHIVASQTWLPRWIAPGQCFGPGADFTDAVFSGQVYFNNGNFDGGARFTRAIFLGDINFDKVHFIGSAWFDRSTFIGNGSFAGAQFGADARFSDAVFMSSANFSDSTAFVQDADFYRTEFGGDAGFGGAVFEGDVHFSDATIAGQAYFHDAKFKRSAVFMNTQFDSLTTRSANFNAVKFDSGALFNSAKFAGAAVFRDTRFMASKDFGAASFDDAEFNGKTEFSKAVFSCRTTFTRVNFGDDVAFSKTEFNNSVNFVATRFKQRANFTEVKFRPEIHNLLEFHHAVFGGPASFRAAVIPRQPLFHSNAFVGARFADTADFLESGDHWVAAFNEAVVDSALLLDKPDEDLALYRFDAEMLPDLRVRWRSRPDAAVLYMVNGSGGLVPGGAAGEPDMRDNIGGYYDDLLKSLEGGCRTVKVAMGKARDELMEQRYYRFQLKARRLQAGTPWLEKVSSRVYALTSDYGLSLSRPLFSLLVLLLVFAAIYWAIPTTPIPSPAATPWVAPTPAPDALSMSASRMFPFGAFESVSSNYVAAAQAGGAPTLAVRAIASLQSLIAATLVFLFGLALRRRFQV